MQSKNNKSKDSLSEDYEDEGAKSEEETKSEEEVESPETKQDKQREHDEQNDKYISTRRIDKMGTNMLTSTDNIL